MISFGVVQKFRSNARPLNIGLEKNGLNKSNSELCKLFKSVRNLRIGHNVAILSMLLGHPSTYFEKYHVNVTIIFLQMSTATAVCLQERQIKSSRDKARVIPFVN